MLSTGKPSRLKANIDYKASNWACSCSFIASTEQGTNQSCRHYVALVDPFAMHISIKAVYDTFHEFCPKSKASDIGSSSPVSSGKMS